MKKQRFTALAAFLAAALAIPASANSFEAAVGTPVIDGKPDDAYKAAQEIPVNLKTSGDGLTYGTASVLWDKENIYVYFNVTDPVLSEEASTGAFYVMDSVDFGLDLSGTPGNIKEINAGHYTAAAPVEDDMIFSWRGGGKHFMSNAVNAAYASVLTENGYAVEMMIPWGEDYKPEADAVIGAVFHINSDEDGKSGCEGNYFSGEGQQYLWKTTENYDSLTLTSKKYERKVVPISKGFVAEASGISGAMTASLKKAAENLKINP